jgi:1-acyl-sn-glycerol-3-phosphate acyltransferase
MNDIPDRKSGHRKGTAEQMWAPIKLKLNANYTYLSKNIFLRLLYYFGMLIWMPFAYLVFRLRFGFKVSGKKNVKLIKDTAAITVANHAHNMDSPLSTAAFFPNSPYYVALPHNFEVFVLGGIVRIMRGIPLPSDLPNFRHFAGQINDALRTTKKKIHFYPEGEIIPYSRELRPFKKGAFQFAVKNDVPVLPMVFVFPNKKRVRLIVGKPICLKDVPNAEGENNIVQVSMLCDYVKNEMQKMMDVYYAKPHQIF